MPPLCFGTSYGCPLPLPPFLAESFSLQDNSRLDVLLAGRRSMARCAPPVSSRGERGVFSEPTVAKGPFVLLKNNSKITSAIFLKTPSPSLSPQGGEGLEDEVIFESFLIGRCTSAKPNVTEPRPARTVSKQKGSKQVSSTSTYRATTTAWQRARYRSSSGRTTPVIQEKNHGRNRQQSKSILFWWNES